MALLGETWLTRRGRAERGGQVTLASVAASSVWVRPVALDVHWHCFEKASCCCHLLLSKLPLVELIESAAL